MKRILVMIFSCFGLFQTVQAQKQDTLLYYMRNNGHVVQNKDSADYYMLILPIDTILKKYPVIEYYPTGKRKLVASSLTNDFRALKFDGMEMDFFENGKRSTVLNYNNGKPAGDFVCYFPNGGIYYKGTNDVQGQEHLIECRDTSGKVWATNGNGTWIEYDYLCKSIITKGYVADSLREGEWHGLIGDKIICISNFHKGEFISGIYVDIKGNKHPFIDYEVKPKYDDAIQTFSAYLSKNLKYPAAAKQNNVQGKVYLSFIVERDGSINDVEVLRSPDQDLSYEATRVILGSTWIPGLQKGMPVRVRYTMPILFILSNN